MAAVEGGGVGWLDGLDKLDNLTRDTVVMSVPFEVSGVSGSLSFSFLQQRVRGKTDQQELVSTRREGESADLSSCWIKTFATEGGRSTREVLNREFLKFDSLSEILGIQIIFFLR